MQHLTSWLVPLLVAGSVWSQESPSAAASRTYAQPPGSFELNQGQTDSAVRFLARTPGSTVYVTTSEVVVNLAGNSQAARMKFVGGNPAAVVEPMGPAEGLSNYFIGNDPAKWRTNVPNYQRVAMRGVYPGIDFIFYFNREQLEYDIAAAPGSDLGRVRVQFEGAIVRKDANGDLVAAQGDMEIRQRKPVAYQTSLANPKVNDRPPQPQAEYVLLAKGEVGFKVDGYDRSRALIIDPVLVFSTYLGGAGGDYGGGISSDSNGFVYVTGNTASLNFPTAVPLQATSGGSFDAFVTKLNAQGTAKVYSTYLGGSGLDAGTGIAVDSSGNAYVTGFTNGNFPTTTGAYQTAFGGVEDAFVTVINAAGSALIYSTYLGGSADDRGAGIRVDASGNAYVTGFAGAGFPISNALQPTFGGGGDAFVTKLNAQGSVLYSTYLGGSGNDIAAGIALHTDGSVVVGGFTSGSFPVSAALQSTYGGGSFDGFVAKIASGGGSLVYATYFGGTGDDRITGISLDAAGKPYVSGFTQGLPGPLLVNAFNSTYGGGPYNAFAAGLNLAGSALVYSTYLGLGGTGTAQAYGISADTSGNAYVTGFFNTASGNQFSGTAFLLGLAPTGAFSFSLPFGDTDTYGTAIWAGSGTNVYMTGNTGSSNFPTLNPLQSFGGSTDAFVLMISNNSNQVAVPNVVNMTKAAATSAITGAGLVVGTVTTASRNSVPAGSVISESPTAGTLVNAGSAVNLVVSGSQPISSTPSSGSAGRQLFSFVARHAGGANSIQYAQFLFTKIGISALNACYISYDPGANVFYLLNDDLTQWYGLLGGSPNTIGNAQCTIYGATSGSTKAGTDLTTNVDISFRSGFAGLKTIYQFSGDTLGNGSGWQSMGTWNDTGDPSAVEVTSFTPNSGNGASQVFTAVVKDGDGANTIAFAQLVMNATLSGFNGCFIHYDRASNVFFLLNDAGTVFAGLVAGSAGQVSNSQCTLHGVGSGGTVAGSNLTITYNLDLTAGFAGAKKVFMQAVDNTGVIEVWHQVGTWTR